MKRWIVIPFALLVLFGLHGSAWANSELHPGGRLFFPLWDVSTPNRLTMIVVTRQALRELSSIASVPRGTFSPGPTIINEFKVVGTPGKCIPRGAFGSTTNVNRTDLGGTPANPIFVDDVHFEYYGRSCISADEKVHLSCADVDLFLLASPANTDFKPRLAFDIVAGDGRGALDVHLVTNGAGLDTRLRKLENSLMGHAIISDVAEGWVATYDAAAAKALPCPTCALIDGGTEVGYEPYPMEVYLPFAFADGFPIPGGTLRNILSLWGPGLFPGEFLLATQISLDFRWWDGRERAFAGSNLRHSLVMPLGGPPIAGLEPPLDASRFIVANFVCGHTNDPAKAENDGFPRTGTDAAACGAPDVADAAHPSDNFESVGDLNVLGHTIQPSTPIGWWRFQGRADGQPPTALLSQPGFENVFHSGRGLVGVVLSAPELINKPKKKDVSLLPADATRLWHEDPCEVAQSGRTIGPPHARDRFLMGTDNVVFFNTLPISNQGFAIPVTTQRDVCALGVD